MKERFLEGWWGECGKGRQSGFRGAGRGAHARGGASGRGVGGNEKGAAPSREEGPTLG